MNFIGTYSNGAFRMLLSFIKSYGLNIDHVFRCLRSYEIPCEIIGIIFDMTEFSGLYIMLSKIGYDNMVELCRCIEFENCSTHTKEFFSNVKNGIDSIIKNLNLRRTGIIDEICIFNQTNNTSNNVVLELVTFILSSRLFGCFGLSGQKYIQSFRYMTTNNKLYNLNSVEYESCDIFYEACNHYSYCDGIGCIVGCDGMKKPYIYEKNKILIDEYRCFIVVYKKDRCTLERAVEKLNSKDSYEHGTTVNCNDIKFPDFIPLYHTR